MANNPEDMIVEEIRRRRQAHAEALGYDLKLITKDLQRRESESAGPFVDRPPRKAEVLPNRSLA